MRKSVIISIASLLIWGSAVIAATDDASITITITNDEVNWCNFQYPAINTFETNNEFLTYARVYEAGVTDAAGQGASDSEVVAVTVTNVNDAPVIAGISDQTGSEGAELTFDLTASDVDNDALTWSSDNLPSGAVFTDNENGMETFITWTPTFTQSGTYASVQFIVSDEQGGEALMRMATRR